ncbi:MAG: DsbA family protein [Pseudomonadota bacterium]
MTGQSKTFTEQGGAATMDPSFLRRWILSTLVSRRFRPEQIASRRVKFERQRDRENRPHLVEYFHQVDDGYSHLTAQLLARLEERYRVVVRCHLVRGPEGGNVMDAERLLAVSRRDSAIIAAQYGLIFPKPAKAPASELINLAQAILAGMNDQSRVRHLAEVSRALWHGSSDDLKQLADALGQVDEQQVTDALNAGTSRRATLKHYAGAMFHYEGEWYWGVDRLHYLEQRLRELELDAAPGNEALAPCPAVDPGTTVPNSDLTLEFFPSLRSPYTAIVFDETLALAERSGIRLHTRPVLPMVMRGVPVTLEKGLYIFFDTAREALRRGVPYGNFRDPIGNPVRRCYALYPWALKQGRGNELLSSFLRHAFALGVNTNTQRGLRQVVEAAGLDWESAKMQQRDDRWEALLEDNRLSLDESGLWGVPSYRLSDGTGRCLLETWGQDRLWLVAQAIRRHHYG